ncbi:unnamed protein product [Caenorhabditis sp. 36 PRJEB53466]|nr:unnamed protein product [Caenorhabditis sp. 36 PRJEB53466]
MNLWRRLWKYIVLAVIVYATVFLNLERIRTFSTDSTSLQIAENSQNRTKLPSFIAQFKDQNHSYEFLTIPKRPCTNNTKLQITILSTAGNFEIRQAIRSTWANPNNSEHLANNDVRISFIISKSDNEFLNSALQKEIDTFDDLIVTTLYESYELLTLKVHALLAYKHTFCDSADFQLKIDDDMAVDMDALVNTLGNPKLASVDGVSGIVWKNAPPMREKKHRWYVPTSLWAPKFFPWYCDGPIYLIGKNAIPRMLEEAKKYKQWVIEDVFWTGVVAQGLKLPRFDWSRILLRYVFELIPEKLKCFNGKPLIIAVHNMKGRQMIEDGYKKIRSVKCKTK